MTACPLAALERLQRQRLGDAVPSPLDVNLTRAQEPDLDQ